MVRSHYDPPEQTRTRPGFFVWKPLFQQGTRTLRSVDRLPTFRFEKIDALRGVAMVWMTLFHFGFDLSLLGYWKQDFLTNPLWTLQRTFIVGLFLFCAGLGQAVAWEKQQNWRKFVRRWAQILGCSLLVTTASWLVFPESYVYFGVLHALAVMLLVARATVGAKPAMLWISGALALTLPTLAGWALAGPVHAWADALNAPSLNWLGLISRKPFTQDYVPLLPWLGVLWWGMAAGQWLLVCQRRWLQQPVARWVQPLASLGRWSLGYYMLHQPVLLGALWIYGQATGQAMP